MLMKDQATTSARMIESPDDLAETRLEAIGFIFHGVIPEAEGKRPNPRAGTNLLHFARCVRIEKATDGEAKIWFRTVRLAKQHLDSAVGPGRWKWCKSCEREITQKVLNEQ